uniref:Putative capsid protein n=1 Tax=Insect-associated ssDNA molecule TaxID=2576298 RepID=A0A4D6BMU8_9VIRU|nr:putative capsid protein [Insect-associated ssDNA molecule]QBX89324.1 putative capsid protein [Insect-associated ssDNA molecule]QBX89326.1 putative capsid protein [Insect-associated ssDNA molecule]QBX89328.1 putative capsid protein [Insect-associated ssDNA molecule]
MPFRKRSPAKRRNYVKRYARKKQYTKMGVPRSIYNGLHHFKHVTRPQNLILSGTSAEGSYDLNNGQLTGPSDTASDNLYFGLKFQLADMPNITALGTLYDSYRINKVKVTFTPVQSDTSGVSLGTPADNVPPLLITVIDRDDYALPTSLSELEQYETYRQVFATKPHSVALTPACSMMAFRTAVSTGYVQGFKKWCDMAQTDIEFYGLKGCILRNPTAANTFKAAWYVRVKYWISCKTVR